MTLHKKDAKTNPTGGDKVPRDWVETAAYFHWEKRGRPHGDPWADWMDAEREIRDWLEATGALKPSPPPSTPSAPPAAKKVAPKKYKFS